MPLMLAAVTDTGRLRQSPARRQPALTRNASPAPTWGKGVNYRMLSSLYEMVLGAIARLRAEDGQTMAEYGLLLAVIAVVVVAAALLLGDSISSLFLGVSSKL